MVQRSPRRAPRPVSRPPGTLLARVAGVTLSRRDQENVTRLAALVLDARGAPFLDRKTAVSLALEVVRRIAEAGELARWHVPAVDPMAAPELSKGDAGDIRAFLARYSRSAVPPCILAGRCAEGGGVQGGCASSGLLRLGRRGSAPRDQPLL